MIRITDSTLSEILSRENPKDWSAELLQRDPSCKSLFRVYKLVCQVQAGRVLDTTIMQQFRRSLTDAQEQMPATLRVLYNKFVPSQAHARTRQERALLHLVQKRLALPARQILPNDLWGKIGAHLAVDDSASFLSMTQACRAFREADFLREAVDTRFPLLDIRSVIAQGLPLTEESFGGERMQRLLRPIASRLQTLILFEFHELPVEPGYLKEVAKFCPVVKKLVLCGSTLIGAHFEALSSFTELSCLDLSYCRFDRADLAKVPQTVKILTLEKCQLQDEDIAHIAHLRSLQELSLYDNVLTGSTLALLPASLRTLTCSVNNEKAFQRILAARPVAVKAPGFLEGLFGTLFRTIMPSSL